VIKVYADVKENWQMLVDGIIFVKGNTKTHLCNL
jgi:hypothetical protein